MDDSERPLISSQISPSVSVSFAVAEQEIEVGVLRDKLPSSKRKRKSEKSDLAEQSRRRRSPGD